MSAGSYHKSQTGAGGFIALKPGFIIGFLVGLAAGIFVGMVLSALISTGSTDLGKIEDIQDQAGQVADQVDQTQDQVEDVGNQLNQIIDRVNPGDQSSE